VKLIAEYKQL